MPVHAFFDGHSQIVLLQLQNACGSADGHVPSDVDAATASVTSFPTPGWVVGSLASTVCYDRRWKAWDPDHGMSWHTTCDAAERLNGPFICGWSARQQHARKLQDQNDRPGVAASELGPKRAIDALTQEDLFDMKSGRTAAALCAFNAAIRDHIAKGRPKVGECAALHAIGATAHRVEAAQPCAPRDRPSLSSIA